MEAHSEWHGELSGSRHCVLPSVSNVSEKLQGHQTNQRAELLVSHACSIVSVCVYTFVHVHSLPVGL